MSLAQSEKTIADGGRAREGALKIQDMQSGVHYQQRRCLRLLMSTTRF
jgi:hypothetical protein